MSARITLHFYSRQGDLFTFTHRGWQGNDPVGVKVFTASADARRFARSAGWKPDCGQRIFLRVELAGRVDHIDLWHNAARPLARPGLPILAQALA